ncbi:glycosyltransferase [archaeon]|nr:glycosyltransferase [archaeon]
MITVGIAAFKEPKIARALKAVLREDVKKEVIVACPDKETAGIVKGFKGVKLIKEKRKEGKPSAVNKILRAAKGDIIVLTDADMHVKKGSLKKLIEPFKDKEVSVACGRPVVTNKTGMMAYWGRTLYDIVHKQRLAGAEHLTTNLCAFRSGCVNRIPKEALVDDYVIGLECSKKGGFVYVPQAVVKVKFPTSISDFLKQRARTFAGYMQVKDWYGSSERSFKGEVSQAGSVLRYIKNPKEFCWTGLLAFFRLVAWLKAYWDYRVRNKGLKDIWQPVETTKA